MKWQDITNALIGAWLIVAAFLSLSANANLWNYLVTGTVVLVLSFWVGSERKG